MKNGGIAILATVILNLAAFAVENFPKPYSPPCTERENIFEFTEKPQCRFLGDDKYEITFAVKGFCDVTVGLIDEKGVVVRHVASGVLGANAPAPFQKNSLKQTIYWDGKDDLDNYVREPNKLRVRVMLGLKPEFDKLLADYGPHNLPGIVMGIAISEEGAFVLAKASGTHSHVIVRRYDHDGNYVAQLVPPPANLPDSKLSGMGYVEYEQGVRALHGPEINQLDRDTWVLPQTVNGKYIGNCQPAIIGKRVYYANGGAIAGNPTPSLLHYLNTDGSTETQGLKGIPFAAGHPHRFARLAASPDGKRMYLSGITTGGSGEGHPYVMVRELDGKDQAKVFVGKTGAKGLEPTNGNEGFSGPWGIDCDAQGRVYVADNQNGRVQIFSPDGKWLKTVPVDRPKLLRVHRKSGAFYVTHGARIQGATIGRLTKFKSFDEPTEVWHKDYPGKEPTPSVMAVDNWSEKPRLWLAGGEVFIMVHISGGGPSVRIYEDDNKGLRLLSDFDELAKKQAGGELWLGRWYGGHVGPGGKLICDPTRETAYYDNKHIFNLKNGAYLGFVNLRGTVDDCAFDKRGYMHLHFNPGFYIPGVGRVDPAQVRQPHLNSPDARLSTAEKLSFAYPEVPYDYGEEREKQGWKGVLPVRDQEGPMYFQDGIGVNMQGDIAEICNIFYVPKMGEDDFWAGLGQKKPSEGYDDNYGGTRKFRSYGEIMRKVDEETKKGADIYSVKRQPGVSLSGGTIWTFDWNGELRQECAVTAGGRINGVMMDAEGALYFAANRTKLQGDKGFLYNRWGNFDDAEGKSQPFTGTMMKTKKGELCRLLTTNAPIPMDETPKRPPELESDRAKLWAEGVEWLYAGASPIVAGGCVCPTQRLHLDWYKRTYVPESYRHSVGVLDTNGNLIMHLGKYGNYDSGFGTKSKIPVGGDNIAFYVPRFISGTDNYLVVADWDERLVVLKLNYHAEEYVPVKMK
jgi:hypothetical protein